MRAPRKVLVVDDSELFRTLLVETFGGDPELTVIGVARDGREALELVTRLKPDVVTMDVMMPVLGGLDAIEAIMASSPTPILVLTGDPRNQSGTLALEALKRGALDLRMKPSLADPAGLEDLVRHVKRLADVAVVRHVAGRRPTGRITTSPSSSLPPAPAGIAVGIVASTGGPAVLAAILAQLPADFPAGIAIVQHLDRGFAPTFVRWLARECAVQVVVAERGMILRPGLVAIAPEEHHLVFGAGHRLLFDDGPAIDGHKPSGTALLRSLARVAGRGAVGVVLTGMGRDGADGLRAIRDAGGATFAQDEATSAVYGMPKAAVACGATDRMVPASRIPAALQALVRPRKP